MQDFGCTTNVEVLRRYLSLRGKRVVDVGCGSMAFTRLLVGEGASVIAIDPDPVQAAKNRAADPVAGTEFVESSAEKIPAEDRSVDGVFFSYSLHHIPTNLYPRVFAEVFRVLKLGGFLYVIEPTHGESNEVMRLFHNEDKEREAAWQALEDIARPNFALAECAAYYSVSRYESWDDYANQYAGKSFNSTYTSDDVRRPEVRETFDRIGGPNHELESHKRVMVLQRLRE